MGKRWLSLAVLCVCANMSQAFDGLVSFGDSLSDVGNTVAVLGEANAITFTGYDPDDFYPGHYSNGPLWVENLNSALGFGTLTRNDGFGLSGRNFAYAGSNSGTGTFPVPTSPTPTSLRNLRRQVNDYENILDEVGETLPDPGTTLFTIWSGGNDIRYHEMGLITTTPLAIANNISIAITDLYGMGGRTFLVPNAPFVGSDLSSSINVFIADYNSALASTLFTLQGSLTGAQIVQLNVNGLFQSVVANPSSYGITNLYDPAYVGGTVVSDPGTYLNWDGIHPTARGHEIISDFALTVIPEPSPLHCMVIGAMGMLLARRRAIS